MQTTIEKVIAFLSLVMVGAIPLSIKPAQNKDSSYLAYVNKIIAKYKVKYSIENFLKKDIFVLPVNCELDTNCEDDHQFTQLENNGSKIVFVQFSSGSTSNPKPIFISNSALMHNFYSIVTFDGRQKNTIKMNVLPLCHDMGLVGGFISNLYTGNHLTIIETGCFLRKPIKYLKYAYDLGVTITAWPDFILKYLTQYIEIYNKSKDNPPIFSKYQSIYCGAEPIRYSTIRRFLSMSQKLGLNSESLIFCYGMAETTLIASAHRFSGLETSFDKLSSHHVACVGEVIDGVQIKINDDDHSGEIMLTGESMFSGYELNNAGPLKEWFATGDIGYIKDNKLYINGRTKDIIIVNGENFHSTDIENYLLDTLKIKQTIVVPSNNSYDVVIVPYKNNLKKIEIEQGLSKTFGLSPNNVYFVKSNDILRTTSGKPIKSKTITHIKNKYI
jgi:acyl-CoA synthetase (AMP-forming)/AMP-acid ligase II